MTSLWMTAHCKSENLAALSQSHQVFLGPTTLGVYKNYAVSAGIQIPVYRAASPLYPRERFRFRPK